MLLLSDIVSQLGVSNMFDRSATWYSLQDIICPSYSCLHPRLHISFHVSLDTFPLPQCHTIDKQLLDLCRAST